MSRDAISQPCTKPDSIGDCLANLAEGWILASDLCPGCTQRFMAAIDQVTGRENHWHPNYRERATDTT